MNFFRFVRRSKREQSIFYPHPPPKGESEPSNCCQHPFKIEIRSAYFLSVSLENLFKRAKFCRFFEKIRVPLFENPSSLAGGRGRGADKKWNILLDITKGGNEHFNSESLFFTRLQPIVIIITTDSHTMCNYAQSAKETWKCSDSCKSD